MVRQVVVAVVVVVVIGLAAVWSLQRRLIYFPSTTEPPAAREVLPGARDVVLTTADGLRLHAWYLPAGDEAGFTVLVAPGNAGDRSGRAPLAAALAERGLSVLLLDYRGYGGNPGDPSSDGLALDVRAARRWLVDTADVPPDRLLYFGESLGAAVVAELATKHPPAAMLLRSPFTDLAAVGRVHYPWAPVGLLLRDSYPVVDRVRQIDVPVTVVYGTADTVVPPEQSRSVADAVAGRVRRVEVAGADHNDPVLLHGDVVVDAVVALARRAS